MNDLSIYREALQLACKALEGYYESCPFYEYDMDMDCERKCPTRTNNPAECWEEYFLAKAKGGYKKFRIVEDDEE